MDILVRIALILVLGSLVIAGLLFLMLQLRRTARRMPSQSELLVSDARIEDFERPSSLVSEQIEEMVRRKLGQYPDLADTLLDFGTAADGTLDIWVNARQYDNVSDIPDERIRRAVEEAVDEFNMRG